MHVFGNLSTFYIGQPEQWSECEELISVCSAGGFEYLSL